MKELQDIVTAFNLAIMLNQKTALATVVLVEGSSYRRAGARMLITEEGQITGAISGGCLEGDALRKARMVILQQKPMLVTYDTNDEDDAKFGVQLGCNGVIHILIEPINPEFSDNPIALFSHFFSKREPAVIVTLFNMDNRREEQLGTCLFIDRGGQTIGIPPSQIREELLKEAALILQNGNTFTRIYIQKDKYTCFMELLQPMIKLVVVGAGNDALPLIRIAKELGWYVTVIDGRPGYNTIERFPMADQRIVAKADEAVSQISTDGRTVIMVMTHNYNYDSELLIHLLPLALPYIGVLGPKKRMQRMLEGIPGAGTAADYVNIHGPAGLDIGSESPEEIALSVLAEIQGALNKLSGVALRKKLYIHDRGNEQIIQPIQEHN